MVVEHSFVTTLEAKDSLQVASALLSEFGFSAVEERAFQLGGVWNAVELRRGSPKTRYGRPVRDWPQCVRVEWDRGRVNVAASIAAPSRGRRYATSAGDVRKKDVAAVQELLITIARSLELLLAAAQPDEARAIWRRVEEMLQGRSEKQRRRSRIILIIAVSFVILAFGLLAFVITNSMH